MTRLKLHLVDRSDFAKFHDAQAVGGGMFVPVADAPGVGEPVIVEVIFQNGPRIPLHGIVQWRRPAGDARTRPGVGVGIDAGERAKLQYLIGYVRGGLIDLRERRRLPVRLRVAYTAAKGRRINFTRDINEEGAFVRTSEVLEAGAATTLLISPPGGDYKPIEVHATVTRAQSDIADRGIGVRFDFASEDERTRFASFVRKLESDYLGGHLPDDVLV